MGSLHHVAEAAGKAEAVKDAKVHLLSHVGTPNEKPGFAFGVDLKVEGVEDESLIQAAHEASNMNPKSVVIFPDTISSFALSAALLRKG